MKNEMWKPVVGYENYYEVSDIGRIKSLRSNIILKPYANGNGYLKIRLFKHRIPVQKLMHRLVLIAFEGKDEKRIECNHKNKIRDDNRLENLEWNTPTENSRHAYARRGRGQ